MSAALPAHAQSTSVPNANTLNREAERNLRALERGLERRAPRLEGPVIEGTEREKAAAAQPGGPVFTLKRIDFSPSEFIDRSELSGIAGRYIGRDVDIATLYKIVEDVNKIYAERGIITALATLPPQKVKDGRVKIKLTEGRLGQTFVAGGHTLSKTYIDDRISVPPGTIIDPHDLNRQISYFNRTNSAQIRALLKPGSTFGLTDIQFAVFEPKTNTFQVFVDNQGVETTGENQIGGFFRRYGLFGMDDRLTVYATHANETLNANVAYNAPIDTRGSRLGVSYSRGTFGIVNGPFVALDVEGWSQSVAVNATTPILVNDRWLIQLSLAGSLGEAETTYADVRVTKTDTYEVNPGLSLSYQNAGFALQVAPSVALVRSREDVQNQERELALFKGSGSLTYAFSPRVSLESDFSWQATGSTLLPGSHLFQAGGPTTVRGYPTNAVAGDEGYLVNAELHYTPGELYRGLGFFAFADHGAVFSTSPERRNLTSVGAGFGYDFNDFARLEFSAARPLKKLLPDQDAAQLYLRFSLTPEW